MSALQKLDDLKIQLELIERKSINSNGSISIEEIRSLRQSIHALTTDLKEELKYTPEYAESYRSKNNRPLTINTALDSSSDDNDDDDDDDEDDEEHKKDHKQDDEVLAWLDENYGGQTPTSQISPTRSPFQKFKNMSKMLKTEIKQCRKYGLDAKNIKGAGWAKMSTAVDSPSQMSTMALAHPNVNDMLSKCWNLKEFDIFELAAIPEIHGHIVLVFGSYLAKEFTWLKSYHLPLDKFHNFLLAIEKSYNDVPYHNEIHAADVCHTMMHFCKTSIFTKHMTQLDMLSAFMAAIIHDVAHTGQTNNFHINSSSMLAIRYNDRSVLENFHLSTAFQILREAGNNFLETLTKEEYKYVRDTVIEMVLGTDLFFHQQQLKKLEKFATIIQKENELDFQIFSGNDHQDRIPRIRGVLNEKRFIMEIALHLSDISNPTKKVSVSIEWTKRITQEFFEQGDTEKSFNLPISRGCDRNTNGNIPKQSLAFIDYIVYPLWTTYYKIDPEIKKFIDGIKQTRDHWQSQM